ncbi:MAG: hypothetical protein QG622_93 [Actinomycetota bacterium]|nr:hypothetical protein [Actinomycetota bacterium]
MVGTAPTSGDIVRLAALRRMKAFALGLLVLAAVVYVATLGTTTGVLGFVNAAAEASMVGAVADWFAVTALFRHPLGIPIPHTALIPTRKEAMGRSLQEFVAENFLSEEIVKGRIEQAEIARRVGVWLNDPANSARVTAELASVTQGAMTVLRDEQVAEVLEDVVLRRILQRPWGPPAGRVLDRIVEEGAHHRLVDVGIEALHEWILDNEEVIVRLVSERAPIWTPTWVDHRIGHRGFVEARDLIADIRQYPKHPARVALDEMLAGLASDLQSDAATMARADAFRDGILSHPDVRTAFQTLWVTVRRTLEDAVEDPGSELRLRTLDGLTAFGRRLAHDESLQRKADQYVADAAGHLISGYRHEVATIISDTVDRWDADDASRRIELAVGRDLQFIRINGTVVGGLVGVLIHAVTVLTH